MNDAKLTNAQITKYSMFGMTSFMAMMPAFMYYKTFLQVNLQVPATMLAVLVFIGTLADFVLSLVSGPVVSKSRGGKYGKYLVFFRYFPWVMFAGTIVVYVAPTSIGSPLVKGMITIIGYIMICAATGFLGNASFGLMAAMAGPSLTDRNRMSAKGAMFMAMSTVFTSVAILPVKTFIYNATGNEQLGYLVVSALFGFTVVIGAQITSSVARPYDPPRPVGEGGGDAGPAGPSIGAMFASVAKNPQLLVIMLVYTIYNFGFNFAAGFEVYYFMFWKLTPATFAGAYTIHATVRSLASVVFAMIGPAIGMKVGGKKNALWIGLALWGSGLTTAYFLCGGSTPWWVYTMVGVFNGMAMYIFSGFGVNYFLDCGEYGFYKSGEDNRTIAMSMFNIPIKLATMLAGTMAGLALGWINFDSVSIGGGELTSTIQSGFMFWYTMFPAICMFTGAALVLFFYKITDKDAAFYAAENAKKMPPMAPPADVE